MPGDGCLKGLPLMADVRNRVLPATIGDDQPRPGTSMTHLTFFVFDHVSGSFASSASPLMSGPRNPGQAAGGAEERDTEAARAAAIARAGRRISGRMGRAY